MPVAPRPMKKKPVAYPLCGDCPFALAEQEGAVILYCHVSEPMVFPAGAGATSYYPPISAHKVGCGKHPLWPVELTRPITAANPRPPMPAPPPTIPNPPPNPAGPLQ